MTRSLKTPSSPKLAEHNVTSEQITTNPVPSYIRLAGADPSGAMATHVSPLLWATPWAVAGAAEIHQRDQVSLAVTVAADAIGNRRRRRFFGGDGSGIGPRSTNVRSISAVRSSAVRWRLASKKPCHRSRNSAGSCPDGLS
jgi:hypothetical protein